MRLAVLTTGLLLGIVWAQKASAVPSEKLSHYEAVVLMHDLKAGADPAPLWERSQKLILSKVGFYEAQLVKVEGQTLTLHLGVVPDMPLSDIQEVLRASAMEMRSLRPLPTEKSEKLQKD